MSILFFDGHWHKTAENRLIGKKLFRFEQLLSRMEDSNRLGYHVVLAVHFVKIPSEPDLYQVYVNKFSGAGAGEGVREEKFRTRGPQSQVNCHWKNAPQQKS